MIIENEILTRELSATRPAPARQRSPGWKLAASALSKVPKIQALPGWGGLTPAWIFLKDLSACTEGPQR